jgi:aspartyl-tRNA(Asn)/glutamyl-tRNA(Gln) amidotransferase subunit A
MRQISSHASYKKEKIMLTDKTILETAGLLNQGKASSVELCREYLDRIDKINPEINAYITVDGGRLLKGAEESDKRRAKGNAISKYDGIPLAIKDNICTSGIKTTCASRILENFIPPYDATAFSKLKEAGFLALGKTNMDEFAMGSSSENSCFGPVKNPWNKSRVPGGSSGGSAAAVASRMAPGALGSDTGGSIRQPASFCGVVGLKPSYCRVSRYGLVAYASSLDQIGPITRSVDDAAAILSVISGRDSRDSTSVDCKIDFRPEDLTKDVSGMRIGVPEEYFKGVSADIADRIKSCVSGLEKRGAVIKTVKLRLTDYAIPIYYLIATAEASSNLARFDGVRYGRRADAKSLIELYENSRSEGFGTEVKRRIILGTFALSSGYYDAYYLKALKGRRLIIDDFRAAFESADVLISPVSPTSPFKAGEMTDDPLQMYMSDILTISANLAGIPGISVPAGIDNAGMPIGLQIMASHFDERTMLTAAGAVEQISGPIGHPA